MMYTADISVESRALSFPRTGTRINPFLARTEEERREGLRKHSEVPGDGLLFEFPTQCHAAFHAYGVPYPFDLVFMRSAKDHLEVAKIVSGAREGGEWNHYPTLAVLEARNGWCSEAGIRVGDSVIPEDLIVGQRRDVPWHLKRPVALVEEYTMWGFTPDQITRAIMREGFPPEIAEEAMRAALPPDRLELPWRE